MRISDVPAGDMLKPARKKPRGRRPALSYRSIVAASLALVDEEGIDALTMRAVAARLGVEAMSLYHHVRNKDDLLDGLMAALDAEIAIGRRRGRWRARLEDALGAFRAAFLRHPEVAKVYAVRAARGPVWAASVEEVLEALREAGLEGARLIHAYRILGAYVTGYAIGEVRQIGTPSLADRLVTLDSARFPLTAELAQAGSTRGDAEFRIGLQIILDGIEGLSGASFGRRTGSVRRGSISARHG